MYETFFNIVNESDLSPRQKQLLNYTYKAKVAPDRSRLSVGETYEVLDKCKAICADLKDLEVPDKVYCLLFYRELIPYSDYERALIDELTKETLLTTKFRNAVLSSATNTSGYISFMQVVGPLINELFSLMNERKSLLVLKKYQAIIDLCNRGGIPEGLTDEELKNELSKLFYPHHPMTNIASYKKRINNLEFEPEANGYSKTNYVAAKNYNLHAASLQHCLHEIMLEYYRETNCLFRQFNEDINIYYLGDIVIVTYKHDEVPNMVLKGHNLVLDWKTRDYWAKMFDPDINFVTLPTINYFIDSETEKEMYVVVPFTFRKPPFPYLGKKVIYAPEEYMDEALLKSLTENGELPLDLHAKATLLAQGFDFDNLTDKLMTGDNSFYFKDPALVDELNIKNLDDYTYLGLIKTKTDPTSRKRCIAAIRAAAKKNPKKPEIFKKRYQPSNYVRSRYPSEGRMPYKD